MKIQLASDLHLEFLEKKFPHARIIEPAPGADLLVLAGDIHNGIKAVELFSDWPVPVLYLAGNHEFYGQSWEQTRIDIRRACAGTSIRCLDNDAFEIGGVRFLGCTLWTDFQLREFREHETWMTDRSHGTRQQDAMRQVGRGLNDYFVIRTERGRLRPSQTLADHVASRRWLEQELSKPFDGKTVVVTHHGPHPLSIHARFSGSRVNAGFVSDLTPLLQQVDLWLHGHVHDSFDYRVGRCRVVANPAGYVRGLVAAEEPALEVENRFFDPRMVLDISQEAAVQPQVPEANDAN